MVQFIKDLFTTVRGLSVVFGLLVSAIFVNAAVGLWTAEWMDYSDKILENAITSTRVDRCITCHQDTGGHPGTFLLDHRPDTFGCTLCHDGVGRAVTSRDAHGQGWPEDLMIKTGRDVQANCLNCHIDQFEVPQAETLNLGKRLLYEKRCIRCHQISSFEAAYSDLDGFYAAGNLGRIANGMPAEWLYRYLKDPRGVADRTAMPFFDFEDQEVQALVAYLLANRYEEFNTGYSEASARGASPARGESLVRTLGCLACHAIGEEGNPGQIDNTREFDQIGSLFSSAYIFSVIYETEEGTGHAPPIPLSSSEAYDLTAYLSTLEAPLEKAYPVVIAEGAELEARGRELIVEHNCVGCHTIPGFEGVAPALPELSSIGSKVIDFDGTRREYYLARMMDPRGLDPESRMPVVYMTDEEADAMALVLAGLKIDPIPAHLEMEMDEVEAVVQRAERMSTHQYRCSVCHQMPWQETDERRVLMGPDLVERAARETIAELVEGLSTPHGQRPNAFRMPTFELSDADILTFIRAIRLR